MIGLQEHVSMWFWRKCASCWLIHKQYMPSLLCSWDQKEAYTLIETNYRLISIVSLCNVNLPDGHGACCNNYTQTRIVKQRLTLLLLHILYQRVSWSCVEWLKSMYRLNYKYSSCEYCSTSYTASVQGSSQFLVLRQLNTYPASPIQFSQH